ncbi:MAG TPA: dihydropteroate synthase [Verrucomicrobiae bacterium]|nr:dihydropteroate synthase [Verrucomicrobiae bacterium]
MTTRFQWDTTRTLVMGVLNVTPDSFSDGGKFFDIEHAVAHAREMAAAGADIIDVGGESSRPGARPVSADEEWRRVIPVIERIGDLLVSIDTTKSVVAERALAAGARIVNDISALRFDERMVEVVRDADAGVVLMHMKGTPQTMQQEAQYAQVVTEVLGFLRARVAFAVARGIGREQIAVDPGIGFGKTVEHNLRLLARLDEFRSLGCAVMVGASRKSFIDRVLTSLEGGPDRPADERLNGSLAVVAWAVAHGANVVRVHDVAETVTVVKMTEAVRQAQ